MNPQVDPNTPQFPVLAMQEANLEPVEDHSLKADEVLAQYRSTPAGAPQPPAAFVP